MEQEVNNMISFLDLTVSKVNNQFCAFIFPKPTATDMIVHDYLCHPYEHKLAVIYYLKN
jgi:hypothetical protein